MKPWCTTSRVLLLCYLNRYKKDLNHNLNLSQIVQQGNTKIVFLGVIKNSSWKIIQRNELSRMIKRFLPERIKWNKSPRCGEYSWGEQERSIDSKLSDIPKFWKYYLRHRCCCNWDSQRKNNFKRNWKNMMLKL